MPILGLDLKVYCVLLDIRLCKAKWNLVSMLQKRITLFMKLSIWQQKTVNGCHQTPLKIRMSYPLSSCAYPDDHCGENFIRAAKSAALGWATAAPRVAPRCEKLIVPSPWSRAHKITEQIGWRRDDKPRQDKGKNKTGS